MAESSPSGSAIEPGSLNLNPDSDPSFTAEIDTSTPFVSVREATNRFGGFGFWKPHNTEPVQVPPSLLSEEKFTTFRVFPLLKLSSRA